MRGGRGNPELPVHVPGSEAAAYRGRSAPCQTPHSPVAPPGWSIAATSSGSASSSGVIGCLVGGMMLGIGMDLVVNGQPLGWLLHAARRAGLRRFPAGCSAAGWRGSFNAAHAATGELSASTPADVCPIPAMRPMFRAARSKANGRSHHAGSTGRAPTLAIDVGGTHLKAGMLSPDGSMTPARAGSIRRIRRRPDAVVEALAGLARPLGRFERISIGFPGVVRDGNVMTAPNLGTAAWHGFPLAATLAERLGAPARMENDATVQGLGVITGTRAGVRDHPRHRHGLRAVRGRQARSASRAVQHPVRGRKTYDQYIGIAALQRGGAQALEPACREGHRLHPHADRLRYPVYRRRQFAATEGRSAAVGADRVERGRHHRRDPAVGCQAGCDVHVRA